MVPHFDSFNILMNNWRKILKVEIKSLYGSWQGKDSKGFGVVEVFKVPILVNETSSQIVYSEPEEYEPGNMTDIIEVGPGEAMCFIDQKDRYSWVAVARTEFLANWIGYYFFSPHFSSRIDVLDENITLNGVPITRSVLESYSAKTRQALLCRLLDKPRFLAKQQRVAKSLLSY